MAIARQHRTIPDNPLNDKPHSINATLPHGAVTHAIGNTSRNSNNDNAMAMPTPKPVRDTINPPHGPPIVPQNGMTQAAIAFTTKPIARPFIIRPRSSGSIATTNGPASRYHPSWQAFSNPPPSPAAAAQETVAQQSPNNAR